MRIGFVTQWFPPERGTIVAQAIAEGLAGLGHDVDVITGFPNYPEGRLYPGYRLRPYLREALCDRITVHRFPLYPSHDGSAVRRMANYVSFAASAAALAPAKVEEPDVWLVYSSPATAAVPALVTGRGAPVFMLIEDLWPDSVTDSAMLPGPVRGATDMILNAFCDWTYRRSAGIGVISPSMAHILVARGVPSHKVAYTPNWVEPTPTAVGSRAELGLPEGDLFLYAGNLGDLQGLDCVVEAFAQVPDCHLVLLGHGVRREDLIRRARDLDAVNVHILPPVSSDEVARYQQAADFLVVSLRNTPLLSATMPSKVQSSLSAGRPLLVCAPGDAAEVVRANRAGATAKPGDPASIVEGIRRLHASSTGERDDMARRARATYDTNFSPAVGAQRLERALIEAVTRASERQHDAAR